MGFFDRFLSTPEPLPEPPRPPRLPWQKPEDALGAVAADELLLARTPETAVAVTGLLAYPAGFEFTLTAMLRHEDRSRRAFGPSMHGLWRRDEPLPDEFLRLGVQFSDGRVATNLDHPALGMRTTGTTPTGPVLQPMGGSGGHRRYDTRYWVWPLPPAGPVTFVCQWPARDIPESRAHVDAEQILAAARRAVRLWPEDDESSD